MNNLQSIIEKAWENRELLKDETTLKTIREVIALLDSGTLRVAEPTATTSSSLSTGKLRLTKMFCVVYAGNRNITFQANANSIR